MRIIKLILSTYLIFSDDKFNLDLEKLHFQNKSVINFFSSKIIQFQPNSFLKFREQTTNTMVSRSYC